MEDLTPQDPQPGEPAIASGEVGPGQADDTSALAQRQKRMFFITFGSIVFVGLALTIVYLGGRVMETRAAGALASKPQPVAQQDATKPAVIEPVQTAIANPEPPEEPAAQNEPKKTEDPKPQLVAEAKPAPPAPKALPVLEGKPASASAPTAPKPLPVSESKPSSALAAKPSIIANIPATPKPQANPSQVASIAPVKPAAPPANPTPPPAAAKHSEDHGVANPSQAASIAPAKPAAPPANPTPPPAAAKHPEDHGVLTRAQKPYDGPFLKPHPGDRYVQVGAYSPNYTGSFLAILEKKGFHGTVASGPSEDVNRVLVGPFSDPDVMKNTYGQLGKAGLAGSFGRKY
jgi:hypothetical protein